MDDFTYNILKNYRGESNSDKLKNYVRDMEYMKKVISIKSDLKKE